MKYLFFAATIMFTSSSLHASNCRLDSWRSMSAIIDRYDSSADSSQKHPAKRITTMKNIQQMRSVGDYGNVHDPKYPITPHCILTSESRKFSQSHMAALLQKLFPDDIGIIANQSHSSRLSHISNADYGKLLNYILNNKDNLQTHKLAKLIR